MTDKRKHGPNLPYNKLCIFAALFIAAFLCFAFFGYSGLKRAMPSSVFAEQTVIFGVNVGGMNYEQGREQVYGKIQSYLDEMRFTVVYNDIRENIDYRTLGVTTDADQVLTRALNPASSSRSPLSLLTGYVALRAEQDAGNLVYDVTFNQDNAKLIAAVKALCSKGNVPSSDALAIFDKDTRTFSYIQAKPGLHADADVVVEEILRRYATGDYGEVKVTPSIVLPSITDEAIRKNTKQLCVFTTRATGSQNRTTNIRLMCEAVDGLVISPGEVLSLNELVGRRTEEKGFMPAPAIMDGTMLVDDIGGGICQLAGTLYNAALLADMQIVQRVRHSFPSDYLPIGQDSTLNWNNKDLKIQNRSDWPLYISARLEENECTVALFGAFPKGDIYTIEVVNDIVQTMRPGEQTIRYTNDLPAGKSEVLVKARTGYEVYVYRDYYIGDKLMEREQITHDVYPAISGVVNMSNVRLPDVLPADGESISDSAQEGSPRQDADTSTEM